MQDERQRKRNYRNLEFKKAINEMLYELWPGVWWRKKIAQNFHVIHRKWSFFRSDIDDVVALEISIRKSRALKSDPLWFD